MPQKIISFSNQKGGVGKTTLTREIGIYLAFAGKKTLLIDTDPQANLTKSLVREVESIEFGPGGLYSALSGDDYSIREVIPNLSILPGSIKLAVLEKSLIGELDAYTRLNDLLKEDIFKDYEYILIDTPPSLVVLTVNALVTAKYLLIPMNPTLYSMQGTNDLMTTVAKVRKNLNEDLQLLGVIINAFEKNPVITRQIRSEIEHSFNHKVFATALSKSIKIEEAIAAGCGLIENNKAKSKDEIELIGEEFIKRLTCFDVLNIADLTPGQGEEEHAYND